MNVGGYDKEDKAARSYDLAALKYWGTTTTTNFPVGFWLHNFKWTGQNAFFFVNKKNVRTDIFTRKFDSCTRLPSHKHK